MMNEKIINVNDDKEINAIYAEAEKYKAEITASFKAGTAQLDLWFREVLKAHGLNGQVKAVSGSLKGRKGRFLIENGSLAFVYESGRSRKKTTAYCCQATDWLKWECGTSPQAIMNRVVKEYVAV